MLQYEKEFAAYSDLWPTISRAITSVDEAVVSYSLW